MKHYGLLGKKLGHSWSAPIHEAIFDNLGIEGEYELYPTEEQDVPRLIDAIRLGELEGLNVTIPYKQLVMPYLDKITEEAETIGAVNTISREGDSLVGHNTDYFGFRGMLERYDVPIKGQRVIVLGSGGASRTVVACLKDMNAEIIHLVSRDPEKASSVFGDVKVIGYDAIKDTKVDVLVNTTPAGMAGFPAKLPMEVGRIPEVKVAVDLIYNPLETPLLQHCNKHGAKTVNGLYMLVAQAVKAQEIWQKASIDQGMIESIYEMMMERMT